MSTPDKTILSFTPGESQTRSQSRLQIVSFPVYDATELHTTWTFSGTLHYVHEKERMVRSWNPILASTYKRTKKLPSHQNIDLKASIQNTESRSHGTQKQTHSNRPTSKPCSKPFTLNVLSLRQFSSWLSTLNLPHTPRGKSAGVYCGNQDGPLRSLLFEMRMPQTIQ